MYADPRSPLVPAAPVLRELLLAVLPVTTRSWTTHESARCWGRSFQGAEQMEEQLHETGLLLFETDGQCCLAAALREDLLVWLINHQRERAWAVLQQWRQRFSSAGDLSMMACCHEHLSNLMLLQGSPAGAIAELFCALALYECECDQERVARVSWRLGCFLARSGDPRGYALIRRAADLADALDLEQRTVYRARVNALDSDDLFPYTNHNG